MSYRDIYGTQSLFFVTISQNIPPTASKSQVIPDDEADISRTQNAIGNPAVSSPGAGAATPLTLLRPRCWHPPWNQAGSAYRATRRRLQVTTDMAFGKHESRIRTGQAAHTPLPRHLVLVFPQPHAPENHPGSITAKRKPRGNRHWRPIPAPSLPNPSSRTAMY